MSLKKYSLRYKFNKIGGIKSIFTKSWLDLYISIIITLLYIALVLFNVYDVELWKNSRPTILAALTPIGLAIAFMAFIAGLKRNVILNTSFNKKLNKNDFLSDVEFYYDFTLRLSLVLIVTWLIFISIWFIINNFKYTFIPPHIIIAYLFAIPIFLFTLNIINIYYCWEANEIYSRLEIEYDN